MNLDELKKICEAATPRNWECRIRDEYLVLGDGKEVVAETSREPDAEYIATFNPELVAKLLAVVEAAVDVNHRGQMDVGWGSTYAGKAAMFKPLHDALGALGVDR